MRQFHRHELQIAEPLCEAGLCISYNKLYRARWNVGALRSNRSAAGETSILEWMSSGPRNRSALRSESR